MRKVIFIVLSSFIGQFGQVQALDPKGIWFTKGQRAKIEISACGSDAKKICGTIVALREPIDPETKKPKLDKHEYKGTPLIGLQTIKNMEKVDGENKWENGTAYDPKNGKTYEGNITMSDNETLHLRGFVLGISMLGRTQDWKRTTMEAPFTEQGSSDDD